MPDDISIDIENLNQSQPLSWSFTDLSTNGATYTLKRNGIAIVVDGQCKPENWTRNSENTPRKNGYFAIVKGYS